MDEAQLNRSKKAAKALKSRVDLIERHLQPLLKNDLVDTYNALPINEKCQLDVMLTYAINTLYYMYIRTQGQDPQQHDVFNELRRVQRYIEKIKVAEGRGPKPKSKVDKDAAGRFVKAALNSKTSHGDHQTRPLNTKKRFADSDEEDNKQEEEQTKSPLFDEEKQEKNDVKGKNTTKKRARIDPFSQ